MRPLRAENPEQEKTLVSWKEIASFLDRAERTVRRWERERGLPVHRVPGGERGGVYAYPSELADWLRGKSGELEAESASDPERTIDPNSENANEANLAPRSSESAALPDRRNTRHTRFAVAGIAAVLAGAAIYASFARPIRDWTQRRFPSLAAVGLRSPRHEPLPVSDAEKTTAHDLYLKARFEWNQRTPDSLNRALDDFTQAIVHNPNDAHAYAGLADAYEMLFIYGNRQDDDARDRAMAAARKAVELDASLSEAHRALGYAIWRGGNLVAAEKELRLAIQLDPKDPLAHLWLSNVLASHGEFEECSAEINRAQELDPSSASILAVKGDRLYWLGMKEEGLALLNEALRSESRLGIAHWYLAAIAFSRRDYPTYLRESRMTAEIRNDPWLKDVTANLSAAYSRGADRGLLDAEFAVQQSCDPPVYAGAYSFSKTRKAIQCMTFDRKTEALQLLEEASTNQEKEFEDFRITFLSGSPRALDSAVFRLADDPRFKALMNQKADIAKAAKHPTSPQSGIL